MRCRRDAAGFTLAELLLALAILGVIAAFTIPKVLQSQQDGQYNAKGKEAAAMISGAFQALSQQQGYTQATTPSDLTPYMNYVLVNTANTYGEFSNCQTNSPCLLLHNGAVLKVHLDAFGDTSTTSAIRFRLDPDVDVNGQPVLEFYQYFNGRLTTRSGILPNTCDAGTCIASPASDPAWFSWN